jgi:primosomal protein N' (replication factor Y)
MNQGPANIPALPIVRVAIDTPLRKVFDYRVAPAGLEARVGTRVRVAFGRQRVVGVVVEQAGASDVAPEKLRSVLEVIDPLPIFDHALLELLRWAADYYHHPLGTVVAAALPQALRLGVAAAAQRELWRATAAGHAATASGAPSRAPAQRALLELLAASDGVDAAALRGRFPQWRAAARALQRRGWIEVGLESEAPAPTGGVPDAGASLGAGAPPGMGPPFGAAPLLGTGAPLGMGPPFGAAPLLGAEQALAVTTIAASLGQFAPYLLHGITGSGKTEVYLQVIARALAAGNSALVLVPEIGLTPQLIARISERFDAPLAVLHSGLTDGERLAAWRSAFSGRARLVIGTRSAVFVPMPRLGVVIVDEEHDASFKQQEGGFRYSARDLAIMRARLLQIPVVLGSATPALETLHNAATGRYSRLSLPRRAADAAPPRVALVDLRAHAVKAGLTTPVVQAIERHLADHGQVLVFINRRGFAPTLACTACGWIAQCRDCDARLTVHQAAHRLRCHYCGAADSLPARCPVCGFAVKTVGQGTERVEATLAALFPEVALARLDRDVVQQRGDLEAVVERVASGDARILIGTQMVTKGHHFPNITLVVVLNADHGLFATDFRAAERLAQTLVQVAGRAGRGSRPGEVLIQTEFPEHPLLRSLLDDGYDGFARVALQERHAAAWPPFTRLAALRTSARAEAAGIEFLREARHEARSPPGITLLGPVPATMARKAARYHAQLLIESADRGVLQRFLSAWIPIVETLKSGRRVRWALDVDPLELH